MGIEKKTAKIEVKITSGETTLTLSAEGNENSLIEELTTLFEAIKNTVK